MARRDQIEEDWDDPEDDDWNTDNDFDADDGDDGDDGANTIACPYCQAEIHDDSVRCPFCENFLSSVDSPPQRRPLWLIVGIVICLLLVLLWILP